MHVDDTLSRKLHKLLWHGVLGDCDGQGYQYYLFDYVNPKLLHSRGRVESQHPTSMKGLKKLGIRDHVTVKHVCSSQNTLSSGTVSQSARTCEVIRLYPVA